MIKVYLKDGKILLDTNDDRIPKALKELKRTDKSNLEIIEDAIKILEKKRPTIEFPADNNMKYTPKRKTEYDSPRVQQLSIFDEVI